MDTQEMVQRRALEYIHTEALTRLKPVPLEALLCYRLAVCFAYIL